MGTISYLEANILSLLSLNLHTKLPLLFYSTLYYLFLFVFVELGLLGTIIDRIFLKKIFGSR